jgi:hypothetical protein
MTNASTAGDRYEILFLCLLAVLAGEETFVGTARFGEG